MPNIQNEIEKKFPFIFHARKRKSDKCLVSEIQCHFTTEPKTHHLKIDRQFVLPNTKSIANGCRSWYAERMPSGSVDKIHVDACFLFLRPLCLSIWYSHARHVAEMVFDTLVRYHHAEIEK